MGRAFSPSSRKDNIISTRASLSELLEFANKVREAGGGNPLDALMPAVPEDPSRCLIAKNLNFNCRVDGISRYQCEEAVGRWGMFLDDETTRDRIAEALDLKAFDDDDPAGVEYAVVLPEAIGQVAADFDQLTWNDEERDDELCAMVEESAREARGLASIVNDDGSIVL